MPRDQCWATLIERSVGLNRFTAILNSQVPTPTFKAQFEMRLESSELRVGRSLAPTRVVLDNGAVFLGKHTRTTPAVAISLAMRAGSICDPDDGVGATWLLSRV